MTRADTEAPRRAALRRAAALRLTWVAGLAAVATVLGLLGSAAWWLDLMAHFRVLYAALLAPATVLLCVGKRWKTSVAYAACLAIDVALIVPLYVQPSGGDDATGTPLRLVLFNVETGNERMDDVIQFVRDIDADLIALQEVDRAWMERLRTLAPDLVPAVAHPRIDNFGVVLLSRVPDVRAIVLPFDLSVDTPTIEARFRWDDRDVVLLVPHTMPPVGPTGAREHRAQMAILTDRVRDAGGAAIVLGDLNETPWSAGMRTLIEDTGLVNSQRGFGIQPTWPTMLPPLYLPLDHCLHAAEFATLARETGPHLGSDHLPLRVTLAFRQVPR